MADLYEQSLGGQLERLRQEADRLPLIPRLIMRRRLRKARERVAAQRDAQLRRGPWHDPGVTWTCEQHPDQEWPHDDCPGPGELR